MFIPYLNFDGTAEAAMRFYCDLFGGSDLTIMKFGDFPDRLPPDLKDDETARGRVVNARFTHAGGRLMASDDLPGWEAAVQAGAAISHFAETRTEAQPVFSALSEGGAVAMPFGESGPTASAC